MKENARIRKNWKKINQEMQEFVARSKIRARVMKENA